MNGIDQRNQCVHYSKDMSMFLYNVIACTSNGLLFDPTTKHIDESKKHVCL